MKIIFLSPKINIENVKGLARYAYEIIKRVEKKFDVEIIERKSEIDVIKPQLQLLSKKFDIVHALSPELGFLLPIIKKFKKFKSIVTFHDFFPFYYKSLKYRFGKLFYLSTKIIWKMSLLNDVIIANSSLTKLELIKKFGINEKRVKIILEGVDKKFKEKRVKKDKIVIGFFGNFSYRKRVDIAIEIFKKLQNKIDAEFIIAGGKIKSFYQRNFEIEKLVKGLKNFKIIEKVDEKNIVNFYNYLDFMIFPSMIEGFGLPILEAQACGTIVLIKENALIPKEVSKYAIKFRNAKDAVNKILQLINDKEKWKDIKEKAKKYAKSFTWEKCVNELIKIYSEKNENR